MGSKIFEALILAPLLCVFLAFSEHGFTFSGAQIYACILTGYSLISDIRGQDQEDL